MQPDGQTPFIHDVEPAVRDKFGDRCYRAGDRVAHWQASELAIASYKGRGNSRE